MKTFDVFLDEKIAKLKEKKRLESEKRHKQSLKRANKKYNKKLAKKRRAERAKVKKKEREKINNRKSYLKRTQAMRDMRKNNGDIYGWHAIYLTKNNQRIKMVKHGWWMLDVYKEYQRLIEQNRKEVICPKRIVKKEMNKKEYIPIKYEILFAKHINPETDSRMRVIRNDQGKLIEHKVTDCNQAILAKEEWYVPETFVVYGYDPVHDKKTGKWILDNLLLNNKAKNEIIRVFFGLKRLFIQTNETLTFVGCKTKEDCFRLYTDLERRIGENDEIIFTGSIPKSKVPELKDEMQKVTGWGRRQCTL